MRRTRTRSFSRCGAALLGLLLASSHLAVAGAPVAGSVERTDLRITSVDDLSLSVREYGTGETPIVLLTGGPGNSGDYLEEMAVRLGKQHRVILPDQRGTGRSVINPWDASRHTIEACVADVEALRVHSNVEQIILVGHSWGGVLAMAYAANHGQHLHLPTGLQQIGWDGRDNAGTQVGSGVYYAHYAGDAGSATTKLVRVK